VNTVRFSPCARTAWHSHSLGRTLHVTDGSGVVATRDSVIIMRAGDTVHTPPGEEHWHGALPDHFMTRHQRRHRAIRVPRELSEELRGD
jgi:quercetin dioxygenase-like cupin family protein